MAWLMLAKREDAWVMDSRLLLVLTVMLEADETKTFPER